MIVIYTCTAYVASSHKYQTELAVHIFIVSLAIIIKWEWVYTTNSTVGHDSVI